jgi:hypothetical protein
MVNGATGRPRAGVGIVGAAGGSAGGGTGAPACRGDGDGLAPLPLRGVLPRAGDDSDAGLGGGNIGRTGSGGTTAASVAAAGDSGAVDAASALLL